MGALGTGLGLLILVTVLIFTWLMVAVFVSAELASFMGLALVALWIVFFLPLGFIREVLWQSRQKKIMASALSGAPLPYQAGTALPPPDMAMSGGAVGGGSSGSALAMIDQPGSGGGAIDIYRELPQLPTLEPRVHASAFKKSLVLPFVGLFMFIGAQNDTLLYSFLQARGIAQQLPIEWDNLKLPNEYADHADDIRAAAHLALRREGACGHITAGRLAAADQLSDAKQQAEQIANGKYVYEFDCEGSAKPPKPFTVWVTPDDMETSSLTALMGTITRTPSVETAKANCLTAANNALKASQANVREPAKESTETVNVDVARSPAGGYLRVRGNYVMQRPDGAGGYTASYVGLSCWVTPEGHASVRFSRSSHTAPQ